MNCPLKSSPEWKALVEKVGIDKAYVEWAKMQITEANKESLQQSIQYFKDVTGIELEVSEVETIGSLMREGLFAKATEDAIILDAAPANAGYVMAFNRIWQQSLTATEKQILIDEVRNSLQDPTLSVLDVSEILASDFSSWKISGVSQFFTESPEPEKGVIAKAFDRILKFIKSLVAIKSNTVEGLFRRIDLKHYKNVSYIDMSDTAVTIGGYDAKTTKDFLDLLNFKFFEGLFVKMPELRFVGKDFNNFGVSLDELYNDIRKEIKTADGIRGFFNTEEGFNEAVNAHKKYLRQFGVNISIGEEVSIKDSKSSEFRESDTISTITLATPLIKLMLSNIVDTRTDERTSVGGYKVYPLTTIWNMVQEVTLNKFNQTEMLESLRVAAETDEALAEVYDLIALAPEGVKNQFFKAFSNTKANGKFMFLKRTGVPKIIDANESNIVGYIMDTWEQAMRNNDNVYSITKGLVVGKINKPTTKDEIREFLHSIGVEYSGAMNIFIAVGKKQMTVSQIALAIYADLVEASKQNRRIDSFGDISKGTYSKVKALATLQTAIIKDAVIENQSVGPDGTLRHEIIRPNPIDLIKSSIKNSSTFEELLDKEPQLARGFKVENGEYVFYSSWLEKIYNDYEAGVTPDFDISIVYGARADVTGAKGAAYKSMEPDERALMDAAIMADFENAMLPVRRAGDKGTQRYISGFEMIKEASAFYDRMWNYFQYEYDQVLSGNDWGLFDGILDSTTKAALGNAENMEDVDIDSMKSIIMFSIRNYMKRYSFELASILSDAEIISGTYVIEDPRMTRVAQTPKRQEVLSPLTPTQRKLYSYATVSLQTFMANPVQWWVDFQHEPAGIANLLTSALSSNTLSQAVPIIKDTIVEELTKALSISDSQGAQEINEILGNIAAENEEGLGFIAYYLSNAARAGEFELSADLENYAATILQYKFSERKIETVEDLTEKFNSRDTDLLGAPKVDAMTTTDMEMAQVYLDEKDYHDLVREGRMTAQNVADIFGGNIDNYAMDALEKIEAEAFGLGKKYVRVNPKAYHKGMLPETIGALGMVEYLAMNHMAGAMEQHFLLLGDLSNYKLKDYFKRMSMVVGNGSVAITDSQSMNKSLVEDYDAMNMVSDNYREHRKANPASLNFMTIEDITESSPQAEQYKVLLERFFEATGKNLEDSLEQIKAIMAAYNNINIADAASVMLLPYYREFRIRHQDWNDAQEATFQAIDKNEEIKNLGYFNTIKPKGFGFDSDGDASGIKTSVMPIYKGISALIPELADSGIEELIDIMMENSTDMLAMKSAVKVGNPEMVTLLSDGEYTRDYKPKTLPVKWFQIQVEMPSDPKEESVEGSQQRVMIFSDLFDNGVADEDIQNLATEYVELYKTLVGNEKADFIQKFGIEQIGDKLYTTKPEKLIEIIKEAAISGNIPMNIVDSLKINPDTGEFEFILDAIPASRRIMNVIFARANDNMIRLKKNIGGYVQVPNLFFRGKIKDQRLNWVFDDTGNVIGAEVYLPAAYMDVLGVSDVSEIEDPRLLELLGYRIPTEGPASISKLVVKGFLPKELGDTVAVPEDIPGVAGSDFDIDKLYIIRPNIGRDGKYIQPLRSIDDAWEKYEKIAATEIYRIRKALGGSPNLENIMKVFQAFRDNNAIPEDMMSSEGEAVTAVTVMEVVENIEGVQMLTSYFKKYKKIILTKEDYMEVFKDNWIEANSREQLQNRILEIELGLASHPKYSGRNFIANSNSILLGQADKYTKQRPLRNKTQLFRLDVEWKTGQAFLSGKDLTGTTTQHLKFRTYAQMAGLKLSDLITEEDGSEREIMLYLAGTKAEDMSIGNRYNIAGELISQLFAQHLTAFVDASADPFIFRLNTNEITLDAKYFMMHANAPIDYVDLMLLQPIVVDYVAGMRKVNSGINKLKTGKAKLTKDKVIKGLFAKYGKSRDTFSNTFHKVAFSIDQLDAERNNPTANQLVLLKQFLEYSYNGESLTTAINAATQDTKGSGKSLLNALEYQENKQNQLDGGIISNFYELFEKTPLAAFNMAAEDFTVEAFMGLSILQEPEVRKAVKDVMRHYMDQFGFVDTKMVERFLQTYISHRIISGAGISFKDYRRMFVPKEDKRFKSGFNAKETIGGKIVEAKKNKLPGASFVFPTFTQDVVNDQVSPYMGLKLENSRMLSGVADLITQSFRELAGEDSNLMQDIADASLMMYGTVNHPNSLMQLLPTDIFGEVFTQAYRKGTITGELAKNIFFANNVRDNKTVPFKPNVLKMHTAEDGYSYEVAIIDAYNAPEYIKTEKELPSEMIAGDVVSGGTKTIFLKKIIEKNDMAYYLPLNIKGMGMMSEYHSSFISIFPSNNYISLEKFLKDRSLLTGEYQQPIEQEARVPQEQMKDEKFEVLSKGDLATLVDMLEVSEAEKMILMDEIAQISTPEELAAMQHKLCHKK